MPAASVPVSYLAQDIFAPDQRYSLEVLWRRRSGQTEDVCIGVDRPVDAAGGRAMRVRWFDLILSRSGDVCVSWTVLLQLPVESCSNKFSVATATVAG
jgi:hypothetical protein